MIASADALLKDIRAYLRRYSALHEVSEAESRELLGAVAERHKRSWDARWWWCELPEAEVLHYGDDEPARLILSRLPPQTPARLVITDDESPPWPVIAGPLRNLLDLIGEHRFFEYMLAADDASWLIFDTHHNDLVMTGVQR